MSAIDDIKERLDIVEVISESVSLRKTGRSYIGFCPFHSNTRTPAFTVYPDTQSFYCFGCQAAGTVFDFVMRRQGLDFKEALQQLASRAGVQLKPPSAEEQQQDQQRTRLLEITNAAAFYFNYVLLKHSRGQAGRDYLAQRAIEPQTVELFQLGYSLPEWDHLLHYLTEKKQFVPEDVAAAGLASQNEQHGFFDRFRGRLIFPIRSARGEIVGFGGRALGDAQPKYLNTPQTLLFDKSQVLYGLDLARDAIRSSDAAVVVEGYIDVITAHQHGFRNVVAPLGTALNKQHVGMLSKLTHNVYLALDADAAGQRATLRGLSAFEQAQEDDDSQPVVTARGLVRWQRDIDLHIIKMPEGHDPDEVIKSDPQQWQALIDSAMPVMDFYIEAYTADLQLSQAHDQHTALERLVPLVQQLDGIRQRVYVERLEHVVGIRAELILDLLREKPRQQQRNRQRPPQREQRPTRQEHPPDQESQPPAPGQQREDYLLSLVLRHPSALATIDEMLASSLQASPEVRDLLGDRLEHMLERTENRMLWQAWQAAGARALPGGAQAYSQEDAPAWVQALDATLRDHLHHLLTLPVPQGQEYHYKQDAESGARHLRVQQARRWQHRLREQAHHAQDTAEQAQAVLLLGQMGRYLAALAAPRRSGNWSDMRDTLRMPEER